MVSLNQFQKMWENYKEWLVANGYPQHEIDAYGDHFYCRSWEEDTADLVDKERGK